MRLGERLVAKGLVTPQQLEQALEEQRASGRLLGETLVSTGVINEETLCRALSEVSGMPFVDLQPAPPDGALASMVSEDFARNRLIAPLALDAGTLRVLQVNPFDVLSLDDLHRMTGYPVKPSCSTRGQVMRMLDALYGARSEMDVLVKAGVSQLARLDADMPIDEAPVVRLIGMMIDRAAAMGATDLHIEPEERVVRLRYRVDGMLIPGETMPKELHAALISRVKVISGMDIAEQRLPQDGRMSHAVDGRVVDLRVSTFPTVFGEKVALRLLEKDKLVRGLGELGFSKKTRALFRDILSKSRGIILVTGPTGAGKTTTLYSSLSYLGGREKNILTVEDPVEYEIPSIRQTQIQPKAGFTFAAAIRSLLRQDPDIIMVGEIRDPETARLALRAALSGILVFSTLHTQDCAGAVPRLMDMGLEPYLLASGVVGMIAQRLLRLVCPVCKEEAKYPDEMLRKVGLSNAHSVRLYRGRGCANCNGTGYKGRTGAFEVLAVNRTIHDLIRQRADSKLIKEAAVKDGMKTLLEDALSKALFGATTLEEVLRIAYE